MLLYLLWETRAKRTWDGPAARGLGLFLALQINKCDEIRFVTDLGLEGRCGLTKRTGAADWMEKVLRGVYPKAGLI